MKENGWTRWNDYFAIRLKSINFHILLDCFAVHRTLPNENHSYWLVDSGAIHCLWIVFGKSIRTHRASIGVETDEIQYNPNKIWTGQGNVVVKKSEMIIDSGVCSFFLWTFQAMILNKRNQPKSSMIFVVFLWNFARRINNHCVIIFRF